MFDPYHRWLAIPLGQRPPTYYQVLGISLHETDPEVINEAAIRQTTHVRNYQTGPYAAECTRVLNEIGKARATLLNPAKRKEYDARLQIVPEKHAEHFQLGKYTLVERVGKGRHATVYKALCQDQVVAVKVLPRTRDKDPQRAHRFQQEAQLARRMQHVHVMSILDAGEDHGLHYLVMEYLEGPTLHDLLVRRTKLSPAEAVRIIHQALLGMQHLHEHGLTHRCLEPSSLMLALDAASRRPIVKILDSCMSRVLGDEGMTDYWAPERARANQCDIRADIYSLGCILYQSLTGHPPFPDVSPVRQMLRHATETPRPPREINPDVPEGLELIVNWMMAKNPSERYPTPERAAQALSAYLMSDEAAEEVREQEVTLVPLVAPAQTRRWQRRDWLVLGIGAAAVLLLEGIVWLLTIGLRTGGGRNSKTGK